MQNPNHDFYLIVQIWIVIALLSRVHAALVLVQVFAWGSGCFVSFVVTGNGKLS